MSPSAQRFLTAFNLFRPPVASTALTLTRVHSRSASQRGESQPSCARNPLMLVCLASVVPTLPGYTLKLTQPLSVQGLGNPPVHSK